MRVYSSLMTSMLVRLRTLALPRRLGGGVRSKQGLAQGATLELRSSSGSLAKFAAMRRASSRVSRLVADRTSHRSQNNLMAA
jgi:hypothetical protein